VLWSHLQDDTDVDLDDVDLDDVDLDDQDAGQGEGHSRATTLQQGEGHSGAGPEVRVVGSAAARAAAPSPMFADFDMDDLDLDLDEAIGDPEGPTPSHVSNVRTCTRVCTRRAGLAFWRAAQRGSSQCTGCLNIAR